MSYGRHIVVRVFLSSKHIGVENPLPQKFMLSNDNMQSEAFVFSQVQQKCLKPPTACCRLIAWLFEVKDFLSEIFTCFHICTSLFKQFEYFFIYYFSSFFLNIPTFIYCSFNLLILTDTGFAKNRRLDSIISNMLKKILTNEVAAQYSWLGAKGKRVFQDLRLSQVITSKRNYLRCMPLL